MIEAWKGIVRKLATVLRGLEEETQWLSEDEAYVESGVVQATDSKVYALCEMVMEDLNCYGECMIPIGKTSYGLCISQISTKYLTFLVTCIIKCKC